MKIFRITGARYCYSIIASLLLLMTIAPASRADSGQQIWQSRDQFVSLDRQDSLPDGTALLNDHPAEISPERLTAILASIEIKTADSGKPEQLITNQSIELLVPQLVQGFHQANRNDDVTFAIIGLHKSMLGLAKSPKVTTGRAFYQGGRLNIIFGLVRKDFNEREDRRLSPFTPGSRNKIAEGDWALQPHPGQIDYKLARTDWVLFSDEWRVPVVEQNITPAQNGPAHSDKQKNDSHSPSERLTTLKELKEKGLISDEEYQGKRLKIINEL